MTHTDLDSSSLLRLVLDEAPFGFVLYRADGPCLWANRCAGRLIGATHEQVLQQDFRHIESWRVSGLLEAALHALETDVPQRRQISVVSSFGKRVHIEADLVSVSLEGQPMLLAALCEITDLVAANLEREAALGALERSQAEFRAIVERHPDAILVLDERERVCFVNPQAGVMLGAAGHQLLGKPWMLPPRGPNTSDVDITRVDGTMGCAVSRAAETRWKGKPARLLTLQDITDLRRTEEELRQRELELAEAGKREALGQLAGSVAHQLNNQLMVLRGHLEMLEEDLEDQGRPGDRFPQLFASLERLQALGRGVMGMGRPQPVPRHGATLTSSERGQGLLVAPPVQPVILLAEDEDELRAMVSESLRARGFQVIEAAHGQQALDLASEHPDPIALLLTDVVMPGMDGVELYEALVQERPEIQVLYMSGYAERDYARLHDLAAQGRYLQKPFSIHYLATKVEQALAQT
jgi:CheY-like chemotaxis protein/PAS domain-containing protein